MGILLLGIIGICNMDKLNDHVSYILPVTAHTFTPGHKQTIPYQPTGHMLDQKQTVRHPTTKFQQSTHQHAPYPLAFAPGPTCLLW